MSRGRAIRTIEARIEAFFEKVDPASSDECWLWHGAMDSTGYGRFQVGGRRQAPAHRFLYEVVVGPVEPHLDIDHLCRVRACVNPLHLEAVTRSVNLRRGTTPGKRRRTSCLRGHLYTPENTYIAKGAKRVCRQCGAERAALRRQGKTLPPIEKKKRPGYPEPIAAAVRFDKKFSVDERTGCWVWQAATTTGYGSFWNGERTVLAHRWSYEAANGAVPKDMVLDHLCRNRRCVNPDHLEPVSSAENTLRGPGSITHCLRGHELPRRLGPGHRKCKECARITWAEWSSRADNRERLRERDRLRERRRVA